MGADAVSGGQGKKIMIQNAMFSSNRDDWETPPELFSQLNAIYHFDCDVCAMPHNAKCDKYYTPADDGLSKRWSGVCWMNPPYGRQIGKWMEKAYKSSLDGATVVCLIPSRTDTAWWHNYVMRASKKSHTYAVVSNLLVQKTGRLSRVRLLFLEKSITPRSS